jgi:hypothetical protein
MNTLSRQDVLHLCGDLGRYRALRAHWSALMASPRRRTLNAAHHLLYCALIGHDWRRGFALTTSAVRIANGAFDGWTLFSSLNLIHGAARYPWLAERLLAPFDGLIDEAALARLSARLPSPTAWKLSASEFENRAFPFGAFTAQP